MTEEWKEKVINNSIVPDFYEKKIQIYQFSKFIIYEDN